MSEQACALTDYETKLTKALDELAEVRTERIVALQRKAELQAVVTAWETIIAFEKRQGKTHGLE